MSFNYLSALAEYVESVLRLADSQKALAAGQPVAVYDASNSPHWKRFHVRVVEKFMGHYDVRPDPDHQNGYLFSRRDSHEKHES